MKNILRTAVLLVGVALSSCMTPPTEVVTTHWGRCGELAKTQYFSTNPARRLGKEVFFGFQGEKMMELHYDPPIVEVKTFDRTGTVIHVERRNLSNLAHANRGRPYFELLYFPVVSITRSGYVRVDYFNYILYNEGMLETSVYFRKEGIPEDPFGQLKTGMSRQEVENLAGKPILTEAEGSRVIYYSGIYVVTIEYVGDALATIKTETATKYQ